MTYGFFLLCCFDVYLNCERIFVYVFRDNINTKNYKLFSKNSLTWKLYLLKIMQKLKQRLTCFRYNLNKCLCCRVENNKLWNGQKNLLENVNLLFLWVVLIIEIRFNVNASKAAATSFRNLTTHKNISKESTCWKLPDNLLLYDLNCEDGFHSTCILKTGLFDFQKWVASVLYD